MLLCNKIITLMVAKQQDSEVQLHTTRVTNHVKNTVQQKVLELRINQSLQTFIKAYDAVLAHQGRPQE